MSEFDEFYRSKKWFLNSEGKGAVIETWQSQQAKIDKLQARVDEALKILESDVIGFTGLVQNYDRVESILKGNKDEN